MPCVDSHTSDLQIVGFRVLRNRVTILHTYTFLTLLPSLLQPDWPGTDSHEAPVTACSKVNVFHTYRTMLLSQVAKESLHWRVSSVIVNTFKGINFSKMLVYKQKYSFFIRCTAAYRVHTKRSSSKDFNED